MKKNTFFNILLFCLLQIMIGPVVMGQSLLIKSDSIPTSFRKVSSPNNRLLITTSRMDTIASKASNDSIQVLQRYAGINSSIGEIIPESQKLNLATSNFSTTGGSSINSNANSIVCFPSPNASSIVNNINQDINLYTGQNNISIPIYTLNNRSIELPIVLNYQATGVKVDDLGSPFGLGWNLQSGGVVSRTMKGMPDEFVGSINLPEVGTIPANGYLSLGGQKAKHSYFLSPYIDHWERKKIIDFANMTGEIGVNRIENPEYWDTQPDEFNFNFLGYSGKFVLNELGEVKVLSNDNLLVEYTIIPKEVTGTYAKISTIVFTDQTGTKYIFGDANFESVEESTISIKTNNVTYLYPRLSQGTINGHVFNLFDLLPGLDDRYTSLISGSESTYFSHTSSWYLKQIISQIGDSMTFSYTKQNNIVYRQSSSVNCTQPNMAQAQFSDGRTYLVASASDPDLPKKQSFQFSNDYISLKGRRLAKIYSSNGNYIEFIPMSTARKDLPGDTSIYRINVFNKNNNNVASVLFDYESIRSKSEPYAYLLSPSKYLNEYWVLGEDTTSTLYQMEHYRLFLKSVTFLNENKKTLFSYDSTPLPRRLSSKQDQWGYHNSNKRGTRIPPIQYTSIFHQGTSVLTNVLFPWDNIYSEEYSYYGGRQLPDFNYAKAGILTSVVYPTGGRSEFYYGFHTVFGGNYPYGGFRLDSISKYDPTTNKKEITKYSYLNGYGVNYPEYYQYFKSKRQYLSKNDYIKDCLISSEHIYPIYYTHGSLIGYPHVEVSQPSLGKTIYNFWTAYSFKFENEPSPIYNDNAILLKNFQFPSVQEEDMDWKRGLLYESKTYNNLGKLLLKSNYNYNFNPSNFTPTFSYGLKPGVFYLNDIKTYVAGLYKYSTFRYHLKEEITTEYFNSTDSLISRTTNYYNNAQHNQLTSSIQITSKKTDSIITKYSYPLDYTNSISIAINEMKGKNMLNNVIEKQVWKKKNTDSILVNASLTKYKKLLNGSTVPNEEYLLENIESVNATNFIPYNSNDVQDTNYKLQINIKYDNENSNPIGYSYKNLTKLTYLWDYSGSYPVAEIKNADSSDVAYTSFEAESHGNWIFNGQAVSDTTAPTGKKIYRLSQGSVSKAGLLSTKKYLLSFCYKDLLPTIQGGLIENPKISLIKGDWKYYECTIANASNVIISGNIYIDEIKLRPLLSQITTYTYEPLVGVTSITDSKGLISNYSYDNGQRLKYVKKANGDIIKSIDYKYTSLESNWKDTGILKCIKDSNNFYTGEQQKEQKDINIYSRTYNTVRWISLGNTGQCPVNTCLGIGEKFLNGYCEQGVKVYTNVQQETPTKYSCTYHYEWSDGSRSEDYTENSTNPCIMQIQ